MTRTSTVFTLAAGGILALGLVSPGAAQMTSKEAAKAETTGTVKAPETPKEHAAVADTYRRRASSYREDAAMHRQMLEAYKKQVAVPTDAKAAVENPWIKKMRLHCEGYIRDADALAAGAERFAEFHTMRAAELESK